MSPKNFVIAVTLETLSAGIPRKNSPVQVEHENRIIFYRFDKQLKPLFNLTKAAFELQFLRSDNAWCG